jgi:hypothetical protein
MSRRGHDLEGEFRVFPLAALQLFASVLQREGWKTDESWSRDDAGIGLAGLYEGLHLA